MSDANWAKARPISTNVIGQLHGPHATVAHTTAPVCTYSSTHRPSVAPRRDAAQPLAERRRGAAVGPDARRLVALGQ